MHQYKHKANKSSTEDLIRLMKEMNKDKIAIFNYLKKHIKNSILFLETKSNSVHDLIS